MAAAERTHRGIIPATTVLEWRGDGTIYARSPVPLGPYPATITRCLESWAERAPDRPFLARRDPGGGWRVLTYATALQQVRAAAQGLLSLGLSRERPLLILSGNSIEHAVLALASMYCGVPYAPVSPSYSLLARDFTTLRALWGSLGPGLVFAEDGPLFERALRQVADPRTPIATCRPAEPVRAIPYEALLEHPPTADVDAAHARVTPDTIAKILFTSGSTGHPKGVINTQRMLCANQEMLKTFLPLLAEAPPVLCDWLPWNHTFGGNHNVGIVLYNGGTLYIDDGRPTPTGFATTLANLREIAPTAYFNVPRGYDLLVPHLRDDAAFREHFFSRMRMLFCAAAALRQQTADELQGMAVDAAGEPIPLVTGLGATESAPFALCAGDAAFTGSRVGVPVPGVELKLAPVGGTFEGRLRGPSITPGYWADDERTRAAFDEEGFYKLGDALRFVDPEDPSKGFAFEGRLAEDFKLSTGTWVRVGQLRSRVLLQCGDLIQDVVITAPGRDFVGALVFPNLDACRRLCTGPRASARELLDDEAVRARFAELLSALAAESSGSSTLIRRAILLEDPPSIDRQELTDKASVNQKAVLKNRAALVDELYAPTGIAVLIEPAGGISS